jgi:hypothetical protein
MPGRDGDARKNACKDVLLTILREARQPELKQTQAAHDMRLHDTLQPQVRTRPRTRATGTKTHTRLVAKGETDGITHAICMAACYARTYAELHGTVSPAAGRVRVFVGDATLDSVSPRRLTCRIASHPERDDSGLLVN